MTCNLTINIKDAKTGDKLYSLVEDIEVHGSMYFAKQHALDLIQNHLQCYVKAHEVYPVKSNNNYRQSFAVKPAKQPKHATIILNVKWL